MSEHTTDPQRRLQEASEKLAMNKQEIEADEKAEAALESQIRARRLAVGLTENEPQPEKKTLRKKAGKAAQAAGDVLIGLSPKGTEEREQYEKTVRDWEAGAPKKEKKEGPTVLSRAAGLWRTMLEKAQRKFGALGAAYSEAYARMGREYADREVLPADAFAAFTAAEKAIASAKPEDAPESPIAQNDYEDFKKNFEKTHAKDGLGRLIGSMERTIPGFGDMDPGARMLAVEALTNRLYAEVRERGDRTFSDKLRGTGRLEKIGKALRYGWRRNYLTSKYEQEALGGLVGDELDSFVMAHAGIARTLAEKNPNVRLHADGRTVLIDYVGQDLEQGRNEKLANEYNRRAKKLQSIPKEWTYADSRPADRKKYLAAVRELEQLEPGMLAVMKERFGGDETAAALEMAKARRMIEAMSFLSQNPEAGDALRAIATRTKAGRVAESIKKFVTDKYTGKNLKYLLSGSAIRAVAGTAFAGLTGGVSLLVAAGAGGAVGYMRGKDAAKESFRKEAELARKGMRVESKTRAVASRASIKTHQLKTIVEEVDAMAGKDADPRVAAQLRNRLVTHLDFIKKKLAAGEIDFGAEFGDPKLGRKDRFANQYELMMAMHDAEIALSAFAEAEAVHAIFRSAIEEDANLGSSAKDYKTSGSRRDDMLARLERGTALRVGAAREAEIARQASRGARVGAALTGLGSYVTSWFYGANGAAETLDSARHVATHAPGAGAQDMAETAIPAETAVAAPRYSSIEDIFEHSVAHADASARGAEDMLLSIKQSPDFARLTPAQQSFFNERTLHEIAKDAKLYSDEDGSALIPKGSSIEIADNGHMYLVDRARGEAHDLGVLDRKTGAFTPSDDVELEYTGTDAVAAEASKPEGAAPAPRAPRTEKITLPRPEENPEAPAEMPESEQKPTPEDLGLAKPGREEVLRAEQLARELDARARAAGEAGESTEGYQSFDRWEDYDPSREFTPGQLSRAATRAARKINHQINRFFGEHDVIGQLIVSGEDMPLWKDSVSRMPARAFLAMRTVDYPAYHFGQFFKHIAKLADRYRDIDRALPMAAFIKELYRREAIEHVAGVDQ